MIPSGWDHIILGRHVNTKPPPSLDKFLPMLRWSPARESLEQHHFGVATMSMWSIPLRE